MLKQTIYVVVLLMVLSSVCNGMQPSEKMSDEAFNTLRSEILKLRQTSPILAIEELEKVLESQQASFTLRQTLRLTYAKALFQIISNLPDKAQQTLIHSKTLADQLAEPTLTYYYYSYSGRLFSQLEIYDLALSNYQMGYEIAIDIAEQQLIKQSENNIGHVLLSLERYDEAQKYFHIFYQYGIEQNLPSYQATGLNNLGEIALHTENIEQAQQYFQQSLAIREQHNFEFNASWSHHNLSKIYLLSHQFDKAIFHVNLAIDIRKRFNNIVETLHAQLTLANIYQEQKNYPKAIGLLKNIVEQTETINHHQIYYLAQKQLKSIYEKTSQFEQAFKAAEAELISQKIILQQKTGMSLEHIVATTELKTKELEVLNLTKEKEIALEKQRSSQQQTDNIIIATLIIAFGTLLFIFHIRGKNTTLRLAINELESTQKQLIESEKVSALTTLVSGMAHQLNTPLGVIVTANSIQQEKLLTLESLIENKTLTLADMKSFVKQSKEAIILSQSNTHKADEMIRQFKLISAELEGCTLQAFEIRSFIESKLNLLVNQSHTITQYFVDGPEISISNYPDVLIKVLDQLIKNSIEHNQSKPDGIEIKIEISQMNEAIKLEYTDNGSGIESEMIDKIFNPFFTTKGMQSSLGLGLNIAYNSVSHLMGGKLTCHPSTTGAKFIIELPMKLQKEIVKG